LGTDLISDGFFWISTKGKFSVEQGKFGCPAPYLQAKAQNRGHRPGYSGRVRSRAGEV